MSTVDRFAYRTTLKSATGSKRKLLVTGAAPRVGDVCTVNGQDFAVVKVKPEKIIAEFSTEDGKLTQVFP
jgi:hypothetical protein